jgi:hypothetical protein
VLGVQGFRRLEGNSVDRDLMAHDGDAPGGVLVRGAFEEDDPVTWDTRSLGWAP